MKIPGYIKVYFGLPYRRTEDLIRTYHDAVPAVPDYTVIHKRICKMNIKQKPNKSKQDIVLAIDSTGIKVTNSGDWIAHKWHHKKRGFLKIHVGVDIDTKQILAVKVTDEH